MTLLAHVDGTLGVPGELVLVGLVLAGTVWADRRGVATGVLPTRRRAALWLAAVAGTAAVTGPLEVAAHQRFVWHMAQHLVLLCVVAPALVVARPDLVLLRALPGGPRRRTVLRTRAATPPWPLAPLLASLGLAVWLWVAHVAAVYAAQMGSALVHAAEHAVWVGLGVAVWGVLLRQRRRTSRRVLTPLLVLVVVMPAASTLALVLLGAPAARFAHHGDLGAAAALADQRLGAGLMWAVMSVVLLGWSLVVIGTSEPRERISEAGARATAGPPPPREPSAAQRR